jgi:predicted aspartyl protease
VRYYVVSQARQACERALSQPKRRRRVKECAPFFALPRDSISLMNSSVFQRRTIRSFFLSTAALAALVSLTVEATTLQLASVGAKTKARMLIDGSPRDLVVDQFTDEGLLLEKIDGDYALFMFNGEKKRMRVGEIAIVDSQTQGFVSHQVRADQKDKYLTPALVNGGALQAEIDRRADAIVIPVADADRLGLPYKEKPSKTLKVPPTPAPKDETKEAKEAREAKNAELEKLAKDGKPVTYKTYTLPLNSIRVGSIDVYGIVAIVSEKPGLTTTVIGKPFLKRVAPSWSNRTLTIVRR